MNSAVKWLGAGLMGSLLLNFFLIFILVRVIGETGGMGGMGMAFHRGPHGPDFTFARLGRHLSSEARDVVHDTITSRREQMHQAMSRVQDARREVGEALSADVFDTETLSAAFGEVRDAHQRMQMAIHEAIVEAAEKLPDGERKNLAKAGKRFMRGMDRHHLRGMEK